jgi:uncharacterized repeat protein (TIGR01451 family)
MKNQSTIVACRRRWLAGIVTAILLTSMASLTSAKSLYVITEIVPMTGDTPIAAYDIGADGRLTYQTTMTVPFLGGGGVGLTIDSDSETLFVTYEYTNDIRVINATTLEQATLALAPDATDLAGIVYDHDKRMLYCIDRGTAHLYCYRWEAATKQLNLLLGSPFELEGATGYGIALDEAEDLLYVGGPSREVHVYNTSDWSLARTIPLNRTAISVAVDSTRHYVYSGAGYVENYDLTQYDLLTGEEKDIQVSPSGGVMGLAVDSATGYIYVTNGRDNRPDANDDDRNDLRVYDTHLNLIQNLEHFARDPTGIAIPGKQTSYNPLHLVKMVEGLTDETSMPEIPLDKEFTYTVTFDHNDYVLSDVTILDTLPAEVTFVRADGDSVYGQYDQRSHTYLWTNPPLGKGSSTSLNLVARVKPQIPAGTTIKNDATIDSAQTPPSTTSVQGVTAVVVEPYNRLNVTKTVVSTGVNVNDGTGTVYASPGSIITYQICYDNRANTRAVNNVTLVDTLPDQVTFVGTGNGERAGYNGSLHTYTWSLGSLAAGASGCVELAVQVNRDVAGGSTITNGVTIDSDETQANAATATVQTLYDPLGLTKTVKSGATADPAVPGQFLAKAGDEITYEICFTNTSATHTATGVRIVDMLPPHTTLVSAEGPDTMVRYYDQVAGKYTWEYGSLAPGARDCLDLVLHVDEGTPAGTSLINSVEAAGQQTESASTTATVIVSEEEPPTGVVDAQMYITPSTLSRSAPPTKYIQIVVHVPNVSKGDIDGNAWLTLDPGGIHPVMQSVIGSDSLGKVMAQFSTAAVLDANQGTGSFLLTVTGKLKDGRLFQDKEDIQINP